MRKIQLFFCISLATAFFMGCATGEHVLSPRFHDTNPDKVAVVDVVGDIRGGAAKNQVEDFFSMQLLRKNYRVIERERVNSVLAEQDFQHGDRTSDQGMSQIGQVLNVPAVAMLDVTVDGEKVSITGRMVDAETGEVIWIGTGRGGSGRTFSTILGAVTGGLLGSQVGDGRTGAIGAAAGGALGGAAGEALSPQAARVVQRATEEMVEELPER